MKIKIMKAALDVVPAEKVTASVQSDMQAADDKDLKKVIARNEKKQNTKGNDRSPGA